MVPRTVNNAPQLSDVMAQSYRFPLENTTFLNFRTVFDPVFSAIQICDKVILYLLIK